MNDLNLLFRGRIKVMSTIASQSPLNISATVRDSGIGSKGPSAGNGLWRVEWSHFPWRHV